MAAGIGPIFLFLLGVMTSAACADVGPSDTAYYPEHSSTVRENKVVSMTDVRTTADAATDVKSEPDRFRLITILIIHLVFVCQGCP